MNFALKRYRLGFVVLAYLWVLNPAACTTDDDSTAADLTAGDPTEDGSVGDSDDSCEVIVADEDCDKNKAPFVFVHGTYGSGDNIANVAKLFGTNGYCQDRFVAVEYDSVALRDGPQEELDILIDRVLQESGADKVVLAGHSQGTGHCNTYMSDPEHAAKVSHYINYSGVTVAPEEILELAVSSNNDLAGEGLPILPQAPNITPANLGEEDHFAIAASRDAFVETWKFLYGEEPEYVTEQCGQEKVIVEGIAETFGDNVRVAGRMEVYELDYDGPPRKRGEPVAELASSGDEKGVIGPIELKRNVPYEFKAFDEDGTLVGYVYFAPFKRSNRLTRFLKPSDNAMIAAVSTDNIVRDARHVAMVGRYLGGAFRHDLGNSLKINGQEVLTPDNAGKSDSVVGFFMYDDNLNSESDLGALFGPAAFLVGTDVYVDATEPAWIEIEWYDPTNGNDPITMKIPNWPSDEALILLYF